ncbi:hypothetical protein niasHT_039454 [Heterodera trifolii]|uniref:Uncharacterized protein n=1 Tax=Heterodera trifolii TaxID=157864 RepID=A0ABD2IBT9_9BILA
MSSANEENQHYGKNVSMLQQNGNVKFKRRAEKPKMATTFPEMVKAWPYSTFLIILNEFCQRFANLSTVMGLYFLNVLKLSSGQTTVLINVKKIIGALFALLGSAVADGYIGKFRTILYGTIIYGIGKIILSAVAFEPGGESAVFHPWLDYIGILIILVGNGFIVPCVASFGGDQFEPHQERMISVFFSIFYAAINAGALISTFLLPILRSKPCLGQDSCYPLSFAVSAVFMLVATVIFFAGSGRYNKNPPKGNVFADVYDTVVVALKNKKRSRKERSNWLDYYLDTHICAKNEKCMKLKKRKMDQTLCERERFLDDIRSLIRILVMFAPLPMFWALYDQQYSVWLIQAIQMDIRLWGDVLLLPDMMHFLNPLLTLTFIFLFESFIYPLVSCFVKLTPLRKMVSGGVLAAFAFFVSAAVQLKVNATLPELPPPGHAFVSFINTFDDCSMNITYTGPSSAPSAADDSVVNWRTLHANQSLENSKLLGREELFSVPLGNNTWTIDYRGGECADLDGLDLPKRLNMRFNTERSIYFVAIGPNGAFVGQSDTAKPTGGNGEFSLSVNLALSDITYTGNLALCRLRGDSGTSSGNSSSEEAHPCDPQRAEDFYALESVAPMGSGLKSDLKAKVRYLLQSSSESEQQASLFNFKHIRPGNWGLFYMHNDATDAAHRRLDKSALNVTYSDINIEMHDQGGIYAIIVSGTMEKPRKRVFRAIPPNTVSILWQIPQIAIITAAEILFSIPGYEFAYSQSAPSMKTLLQACWFLTVAIGDMIIIFVTFFHFADMAVQFVAYAVAMLVVIFIFALLAIFYYEYRVNTDESSTDADNDNNDEDEFEEAEELRKIDEKRGPLEAKFEDKAADDEKRNEQNVIKNKKGSGNPTLVPIIERLEKLEKLVERLIAGENRYGNRFADPQHTSHTSDSTNNNGNVQWGQPPPFAGTGAVSQMITEAIINSEQLKEKSTRAVIEKLPEAMDQQAVVEQIAEQCGVKENCRPTFTATQEHGPKEG